jgi:hypothetical protein
MSAAMTERSWRTGPTSGEKHETFAATAYMVGSVVLSVGAGWCDAAGSRRRLTRQEGPKTDRLLHI